ncbi:MAG: hypothetical protein HY928_00645 [Elusimicrobia bacterium]|nr:hypothetical protein [Elusimicrobiota bacterium]
MAGSRRGRFCASVAVLAISALCAGPDATGEGLGYWSTGRECASYEVLAAKMSESGRGGAEQEIRACLSCHDGALAVDVAASSGHSSDWRGRRLDVGRGENHPVGIDYLDAMRRRPAEFKEVSEGGAVELHANFVTCLSCHSLRDNSRPGRPYSQRSLCLECHRK